MEVSNDNQAIATAELAADSKQRLKDHYYSSNIKRDLQMKKVFLTTRARARGCDNCPKRLI
jgi:hypothetical protein